MTLFSLILFNTDFGDDFGDDPVAPLGGPIFHLSPYHLLGAAVIIGIIVGVVAGVMSLARQRAVRRVRTDCEGSAKAIYDSVKYHLDKALRAPGASILDRGREVADVLDARLGAVLALDSRVGKPLGELSKALKGEKPKKADGPAKVKVQRPTDEHTLEVWKALQRLNEFWSNQPMVLTLLVAAQRELVTAPRPLPMVVAVRQGTKAPVKAEDKPAVKTHQSLWDEIPDTRRAKPKKVKAAKAAKAEAKPIVMPKPATEAGGPPEPPPTPPPPAPPPGGGKRKKDLPAHKRNMLA